MASPPNRDRLHMMMFRTVGGNRYFAVFVDVCTEEIWCECGTVNDGVHTVRRASEFKSIAEAEEWGRQ